jgi:hypothetical protein
MQEIKLAEHNVIATFPDGDAARVAVENLHEQGIDAKDISFLEAAPPEQAEHKGEGDDLAPGTSTEEVHTKVPARAGAGAAAGAAGGGAAGFLAGLVAFGLPGAGPVLGAGVWAATAAGATAGGVAGGVSGGITKMWELHYRDAVLNGAALVGVHSADRQDVHRASILLAEASPPPLRVDNLDEDGKLLDE